MIQAAVISLLYDHDCVIIPGFGGIIGAYKSAQIDPLLHVLSPPSKQLTFNRHLIHNDGLLANEIALRNGLSYPQALAIVENEVRNIRKKLETENRFDLTDVGLFYVEKDQSLQFRPHDRVNFLKDSFGLQRINLTPVAKTETPVIPILSDGRPSRDKIHWGKIAAVAAFPVALALGIWQFGGDMEVKSALSMFNPFKTIVAEYAPKPMPAADTASFESDQEDEFLNPNSESQPESTAPLESTTQEMSVATPAAESLSSENSYFVIAGAFKVAENAEKLLASLQAEGHNARLAGMKGQLHLVALSAHPSKAEAEAAADKSGKKGVWIFSK